MDRDVLKAERDEDRRMDSLSAPPLDWVLSLIMSVLVTRMLKHVLWLVNQA